MVLWGLFNFLVHVLLRFIVHVSPIILPFAVSSLLHDDDAGK